MQLRQRGLDTLFYPAGQLKEDAFRDQQLRTEVDKAVFHFPPVVCPVMVIGQVMGLHVEWLPSDHVIVM